MAQVGLTVDKKFIKSLKDARAVVFRHKEGKDIFECIIEDRKGREIDREIYSYEPSYCSIKYAVTSAHKSDLCWLTIRDLIKVGDEIRLNWYKDCHTSDLLREHRLHGDALRLIIYRKKKTLEFEISSGVFKQNSVRMIDPDANSLHNGV